MPEVETEFLFRAEIDLQAPQLVGETPQGNRMIFLGERGTFEGPRLKGEFLAGAGDWFLLRPDGAGELDVRITLRTDDGQLIYMAYRGILDAAPAVMTRIFGRQPVERSEYYFRIAPTFQTASPQYAWLNRIQTIGIGEVTTSGVAYDVYAIR